MENKDLAAAAIKLAYQGCHVLPIHGIGRGGRCTCGRTCPSPGKHPRLEHGVTDASAEPTIVAGWWRRWKLANIGIATGHRGLFVIDLDGDAGEETLADLERDHEPLPLTRWVATGSGGRHAYMRLPAGVDLGNSSRKLGPGLDTRGKGGYVVCPPSNHSSGGRYAWLNRERAAEVPRWMLDLLRPPAPPARPPIVRLGRTRGDYGRAALAAEEAMVRMAPTGTRNHTLNRAAYSLAQLVATGVLDINLVAGTLLSAAIGAGLGETEARRTIESGIAAGQQHPRGRTA